MHSKPVPTPRASAATREQPTDSQRRKWMFCARRTMRLGERPVETESAICTAECLGGRPDHQSRLGFFCPDRHAPYVHDRHRPDGGVSACCWRCAVSGGDRVIRWSTALAVLGVAAVAAVASYEHAYDLVRAHGETGWTVRMVPLMVDGLIYASSMVMLDSARRKTPVPALVRWLLGLGIAATLSANVAHGLGHGQVGSAVAAWPAVALVGSYELLMMVIRSSQVPADGTPDTGHNMDPLQGQAAELFAEQPAADQVPSVRAIRAQLHVGQARAQRLRDYFAAGAARRVNLHLSQTLRVDPLALPGPSLSLRPRRRR